MDLELSGMGEKVNELKKRFKGKLDHDMEIVKAAKSAAIRIKVPEINLPDGIEPQKDEIITAMLAAKRLLNLSVGNSVL